MAYSQIKGSIVSGYKHAYYGASPPLDPELIVHAYRHVCERQKSALAQKAILYEIVDELRKIKQAMLNVLLCLYVSYCLGLRLISPWAPRKGLGATPILARF